MRLAADKSTNPIAVGDIVAYETDAAGENAGIASVLPRKNYIIRKSNNLSKRQQIIAANIDQVIILATLALPRTSQGFIDRILATAEAYSIPAIVIFNKCDLYDAQLAEYSEYLEGVYNSLGYNAFSISVKNRLSVDKVESIISGKVSLITGHSGVGKSSLINALDPEMNLRTGGISNVNLKGKHTTTFAEMFFLNEDTKIIDTPGIKDFGLVEMDPREIGAYFPEIVALRKDCRFSNCTHTSEPHCAVKTAVEAGEMDEGRYASYISMVSGDDIHH